MKRVVGEFGKDYPKRIIKHKIGKFSNDNNISRVFYKIEWTCDSQNNKPKSGYHSIEDLKENCPILLIEYFEKNAILIDNNNKKFI